MAVNGNFVSLQTHVPLANIANPEEIRLRLIYYCSLCVTYEKKLKFGG